MATKDIIGLGYDHYCAPGGRLRLRHDSWGTQEYEFTQATNVNAVDFRNQKLYILDGPSTYEVRGARCVSWVAPGDAQPLAATLQEALEMMGTLTSPHKPRKVDCYCNPSKMHNPSCPNA